MSGKPAGTRTGEAPRPQRADARRNREAILRAASDTFEAEGVLASLDGIAARAGVGNATLYRNFPTRDDLLAAVMQDSITSALGEADELAGSLPPRDALAEWLVRLTWRLRIWHDLPHCLATALEEDGSPVRSACDPVVARTAALLDRARSDGAGGTAADGGTAVDGAGPARAAPGGIGAQELYELVLALSWAVDRFHDDEQAARRRVALATVGVLAPVPPDTPRRG